MYTPSEKGAPVQQIFTSVVSIHSVTWLLSIPNLRANRTAENRGVDVRTPQQGVLPPLLLPSVVSFQDSHI
jgi:hypothetical protein